MAAVRPSDQDDHMAWSGLGRALQAFQMVGTPMNANRPSNRRGFLKSGPIALAAAAQAGAQSRAATDRPFRIGCLNVHNYSHLLGLWAPLMNPRSEKKETAMTGMRTTHCWADDPANSA